MEGFFAFLKGQELVLYVGVALAVSESLALIPAVKANGIVDGLIKVLKFIKDKMLTP